jgi:hypothetical protein
MDENPVLKDRVLYLGRSLLVRIVTPKRKYQHKVKAHSPANACQEKQGWEDSHQRNQN